MVDFLRWKKAWRLGPHFGKFEKTFCGDLGTIAITMVKRRFLTSDVSEKHFHKQFGNLAIKNTSTKPLNEQHNDGIWIKIPSQGN